MALAWMRQQKLKLAGVPYARRPVVPEYRLERERVRHRIVVQPVVQLRSNSSWTELKQVVGLRVTYHT